MKRKTISQTEARRLRKRVGQLEEMIAYQRRRYATRWPGGVHVATIHPDTVLHAKLSTAAALDHAIVAVVEGATIRFFALPHPKVPA